MTIPTIVAHRGLHDDHPENSLEAFLAAWKAGVQWCECDVRGALDHAALVLHDETLDRTTTGAGFIHQTTSASLQGLHLRYPDGSISASPLPRLNQVIAAMPQGAGLLIEIKPGAARPLVQQVMELCPPQACVVQSFDAETLRIAAEQRPEMRLELLVDDAAMPIPVGPWRAVNAQFKTLTEETVRRIRDFDLDVGAWTVNDEADVQRIVALGVNRIITDRPLRVRDICGQIG